MHKGYQLSNKYIGVAKKSHLIVVEYSFLWKNAMLLSRHEKRLYTSLFSDFKNQTGSD